MKRFFVAVALQICFFTVRKNIGRGRFPIKRHFGKYQQLFGEFKNLCFIRVSSVAKLSA
jgi:hypothetical protein